MDLSYVEEEKLEPPSVYVFGRSFRHPFRPYVPRIDIIGRGQIPISRENIVDVLNFHMGDLLTMQGDEIMLSNSEVFHISQRKVGKNIEVLSLKANTPNIQKETKWNKRKLRGVLSQIADGIYYDHVRSA